MGYGLPDTDMEIKAAKVPASMYRWCLGTNLKSTLKASHLVEGISLLVCLLSFGWMLQLQAIPVVHQFPIWAAVGVSIRSLTSCTWAFDLNNNNIVTHAVIKYLGRVCVLYCLFPLVSVCGMDTQLLQPSWSSKVHSHFLQVCSKCAQ